MHGFAGGPQRFRAICRRSLLPALLVVAAIVTVALVPSSIVGQEKEAILERQNRVSELLKFLVAEPGAFIADVGAGDGFYTVRIAHAVAPTGRAAAVDIDESALDKLRTRAAREHADNVDVILGAPDDPHLEAEHFDAVFIHNAYHEMREHKAMLDHICAALKPGGRLVVVEPMHDSSSGLPRDQQVANHDIDISIVERELRSAGFEMIQRDQDFVKFTGLAGGGFWLIVARRPVSGRVPPKPVHIARHAAHGGRPAFERAGCSTRARLAVSEATSLIMRVSRSQLTRHVQCSTITRGPRRDERRSVFGHLGRGDDRHIAAALPLFW